MRPLAAALALWCCGASSAGAASAPSCFPAIEIARARIIRVEKIGVLVLSDGRAVRLEGIVLPAGTRDHAPDFLAGQAISVLTALAAGREVAIAAQPPKEDRYDRLRAQILLLDQSGESWLQVAMLRRGMARVSIAPDRRECAPELYAAEAHARAERAGIWTSAAYSVRTPFELTNDVDTFQIIEGSVLSVTGKGGRIFLEFGPNRYKDFSVTISAEDLRTFKEIGVDPFSYQNHLVRVRGWIERIRNHPEMEIALPDDIEMVEMPALRGTIAPE